MEITINIPALDRLASVLEKSCEPNGGALIATLAPAPTKSRAPRKRKVEEEPKSVSETDAPSAAAVVETLPTKGGEKRTAEDKPESDGSSSDTTAPAPVAESEVTVHDVRQVLMEVTAEGERKDAIAILKEHGAAKLPDLDPKHYQSVIDSAKKKLAA